MSTSFNLMKSLNENALPEIKQTKRLREAMENITEGAGAGYHIIGTVENSHVNSFNVVETTEDEYGIPTYIIDCDIDATLEDVSFESYEYGGKVDSASIHITKLCLIDNHEPEEKGELNDTNIEQSLNQTMIKSLIGGGYVHQTFTGEIEFDDDNATGSSYNDFYVEGVGYNFVDSDLINYIDLSVQGENTTTEYVVYSEDYSELDRFDSEEEAIEYAKNNSEAYRVEELSYVYDFGGDIDPNSEYSEIVWEKDDFEESENLDSTNKLNEKLNSFEKTTFSKKVLDAQTDEDLKQIVDEIKYYSEPTYTRCMEIINGDGSTQYKAGQISDILYQLNESNMEEVRAKSAEKGLLEPEAVNEEVIPNSFNMRCPKCGSPNYLEVDDEELEDGTQRYHLVCQDCGYTEKDEFNPLDEAEEQEKSYTITIGYAGFIGVEEDYEVYASSKEEAIDYALENAKGDLEVTSIEKDDEDEYIVYVSFATYMGTDQDYYITADDEGEAEELALEEAASSLEVISINGVNVEDLDESEELIEEEIVSDKLTEVKSQGNVFMLQDNEKYIVGIDYNKDENIINDAEIYNDKDEADKDYFSRCDITLNGEQVDPTEQNLGIDEKITEEA